MKKILIFITLLSVAVCFQACQPDRVIYKGKGNAELTFPAAATKISLLKEDNNTFQVELWRGNTKGALSVPVVITGSTNVFAPKASSFEFTDGSNTAYLTFSYADINNFAGETYSIKLQISDPEQIAISGNGTLSLSIQRKLTFKLHSSGVFYSEFFEEAWDQDLYKAQEADYYRLPSCYYKGYDMDFSLDGNKIIIAKQPMGYNHSSYGMASWDPRYPTECVKEGKRYNFTVAFVVSAGSFGKFPEVFIAD